MAKGPHNRIPRRRSKAPAARPEQKASPAPVHISPESPPALSDRTQSRLAIARRIRDTYFRLFQAGESDLEAFLRWQMRYADLIEKEVSGQSKDFDRVKFLEAELEGIQRLERLVQQLVERDQAKIIDGQIIQFYRLEIEEKLERAKAKG